MPVTDISFENGIYFAKESGRIDKADARLWAENARRYAEESSNLIVALVDALEVSYISNDARRIFAKASAIPGLHAAAVATKDQTATTVSVIGLMAVEQHTYIFSTLEAARKFAEAEIARLRENAADE